MARLFITPREVDFISDVTKEIVKDVIGQKIFFYKVREDLTDVHDVYEEAPEKIFDPPIEINALVEYQPEEVRTNRFGQEEYYTIDVMIQSRDLLDKEIHIETGDYFSYGQVFFEITSNLLMSTVFGQVEYPTGIKLTGKQARIGQINIVPKGPTSEFRPEEDAIQDTFVQQRGQERNSEGVTGDKRRLQDQGKVEPIIDKPAEVSSEGDPERISSSFYGDNC